MAYNAVLKASIPSPTCLTLVASGVLKVATLTSCENSYWWERCLFSKAAFVDHLAFCRGDKTSPRSSVSMCWTACADITVVDLCWNREWQCPPQETPDH
eukprot:3258597-Amphidinium_carterae.1